MSATFTDVSFRQYTNHHMCYRSSKLHYEKSMLQIDRQSDSETFDRTNIISNKVHSASKHTITFHRKQYVHRSFVHAVLNKTF